MRVAKHDNSMQPARESALGSDGQMQSCYLLRVYIAKKINELS